MSTAFKIAPGRWDVPGIGKVDSNKEVSDEKAFSLYRISRRVFPWISLGPDAATFLKKQKLNVKEISSLVHQARSVEEVEILADLSNSKPLAGIVQTKLNALQSDVENLKSTQKSYDTPEASEPTEDDNA